LRFYTEARLFSIEARLRFVPPDRDEDYAPAEKGLI
jgi:hypothetical protein